LLLLSSSSSSSSTLFTIHCSFGNKRSSRRCFVKIDLQKVLYLYHSVASRILELPHRVFEGSQRISPQAMTFYISASATGRFSSASFTNINTRSSPQWSCVNDNGDKKHMFYANRRYFCSESSTVSFWLQTKLLWTVSTVLPNYGNDMYLKFQYIIGNASTFWFPPVTNLWHLSQNGYESLKMINIHSNSATFKNE